MFNEYIKMILDETFAIDAEKLELIGYEKQNSEFWSNFVCLYKYNNDIYFLLSDTSANNILEFGKCQRIKNETYNNFENCMKVNIKNLSFAKTVFYHFDNFKAKLYFSKSKSLQNGYNTQNFLYNKTDKDGVLRIGKNTMLEEMKVFMKLQNDFIDIRSFIQ